MSQISVSNLTFYYDGSYDNIFENVSFQIDTDWKLGFIARNGRGKTTFLQLLMGKYEYKGYITSKALFDYFPFQVSDKSRDSLTIIEEIYPDIEFWKICRELSLLQVDAEVLYRPFETLSSGEQTKVMLAALFSNDNRFLLIDEPTNHLDIEAREMVSGYLNKKKGFILVSHDRMFLDQCIDHVLSINKTNIEIQQGCFSSWWENKRHRDEYEAAENERLKKEIGRLTSASMQAHQWADKVEAEKIGAKSIKHEKSIELRSYIGEKSRRMQMRRKNLERRQERAIEEKSTLLQNIETADSLKLFPLRHHKEVLVHMENVGISYGLSSQAVTGFHMNIRNGETVVLKGRNGCGKSSIIKSILKTAAGLSAETIIETAKAAALNTETAKAAALNTETASITDTALNTETAKNTDTHISLQNVYRELLIISGTIELASGLRISYIPQDTSHLKGSLDEYAEKYGIQMSLFKALLRKLDFSRVQFDKKMENYSGGQKKKVLIARSLCEQAHLYLWDEPLNFIDIFSRMQIEELIKEYQPTLLMVEHDKTFVEAIKAKAISL